MRPAKNTYPPYYENYIPLVREQEIMPALLENWKEVRKLAAKVDPEKENFLYAPRKWSVKQVFHHLSDTERIMAYRALRFARKDPQKTLPFAEDDYAANANVGSRTLKDIVDELETVRSASISLFRSFSDEALLQKGVTGMGETTVIAIGYLICGHALHHLRVLEERYEPAFEK